MVESPSMTDLHQPSRFWQSLGAEHADDLARHGLDQLKRRQALRYFTWQWRARRARGSEQLAFLLRHSAPATLARAAIVSPAALAASLWQPLPWSLADRWLYTFAVRLLWAYAARDDRLHVLDLAEPELGHPPPVEWRGRLISQDLANGALEVNALGRALAGPPASILEIGGGYGRTAYVLLSIFPRAAYTIVDIEPALSISRWYLTRLFPGRSLSFVPAQDAGRLAGGYDLALSISSLQEMLPEQVAGYLGLLDRLVAPGGAVYLKQWQAWQNPTDGVTLRFAEYPIPARWRRSFVETCPVQTRFTQAAWNVP